VNLTEHQRRFFDVFGFLRLPGLFADDISRIGEQFDAVYARHAGDVVEWVHATHENRMRRFIPMFLERDEYLRSLLDDPRVTGIAKALLGEPYRVNGSDGSIYDCGTLYHSDGYGADMSVLNIKMALYLEPVDASSGAIRVLPGTHHHEDAFSRKLHEVLYRNMESSPEAFGASITQVPSHVLASEPGDLLLWNYRLLHASCWAGNRRRMIAVEFSQARCGRTG
jgi:hypothetical protein